MNWKTIAKLLGYSEKVNNIYNYVLQLARSEQDDKAACTALRKRIGKNRSRAARSALALLSRSESDYETDRAGRLLEAVINDQPVSAVDPTKQVLFMRERELGLLSLHDAIAALSELEPRLTHLLNEVINRPSDKRDAHGTVARLNQLVGPNADLHDELVKSQLALSVVSHYIAGVNLANENDWETSYFAAPRQLVVRAGRLG
jgi:hypothetical protein